MALSPYQPYGTSLENLLPLLGHAGSSDVGVDEREEVMMATIMGMEMDQESVWWYEIGPLNGNRYVEF